MGFETARIAIRITSATIGALVIGISCASAATAEANNQLLLRGPVDNVNPRTMQIEVLGQWISTRGMAIETLQGRFVTVDGTLDSRGNYVVSAIEAVDSIQYVPGATPVYLSGMVESINKASGVLVLAGGVTVDYTAALST